MQHRAQQKWQRVSILMIHSGQTQKPTSHPVVCISSKPLRSEVRKKALLDCSGKTKYEAITSEVNKQELFNRHSTFKASLSSNFF